MWGLTVIQYCGININVQSVSLMSACPLLVSCLPLGLLYFSTFSIAMQIAMLKCKVDPVDVTNLACAMAVHFKASLVVTSLDCLLCSIILINFLDFLVFTCHYNSLVDSLHVLDPLLNFLFYIGLF